jgi:hypothetical protein
MRRKPSPLFRKSPVSRLSEPGEFRPTPGKRCQLLEDCARSDDRRYLIAEVDGELAGMLHFQTGRRKRNARAGEFGMSVRKRGMSIGRKLLQGLLQCARQTGKIRKINLRGPGGQRAGRSVGFKVEGAISREFCIGGRFYDAHWMGIELD